MAMNFEELQAEYEKAKAVIANHESRLVMIENLFCTICSGVSLLKRMASMVCGFCDVVDAGGSIPIPSPEPEPAPPTPWPTTPESTGPVHDPNNPPPIAFTAVEKLALIGGQWHVYFYNKWQDKTTVGVCYQQANGDWTYRGLRDLKTGETIEKLVDNPWKPSSTPSG